MRCYICDKALTEAEIQLTPDGKSFEPCAPCLEAALDAAYSDGFVREEELDDPELQRLHGNGAVEVLDAVQQEFDLDGFRQLADTIGLSDTSPLE